MAGSSHREGSNFSGFGKTSSLRCIIHELMPTIVWFWVPESVVRQTVTQTVGKREKGEREKEERIGQEIET